MNLKLPEELNQILSFAREEAMRLGSYTITGDHIFLAIIRHQENQAYGILTMLDLLLWQMKNLIESKEMGRTMIPPDQADKLSLSEHAEKCLKAMYLEATKLGQTTPNSLHLLLAMLALDNGIGVYWLRTKGVTDQSLRAYLKGEYPLVVKGSQRRRTAQRREAIKNMEEDMGGLYKAAKKETGKEAPAKDSSRTPMLDMYALDLTEEARSGQLDPVVCRDREIDRLAQILGRRKKNNPVLIGEPGVGKSAIVEGLALRIARRKGSPTLQGKKILSLDIGSVVAGTKYRGQFEERMKALLAEIKKNPDIILFIDEIHTLIGAGATGGGGGSLDAANMLKPALARGEIQCIGASTMDEYREYIEKDGALERRFQKVIVDPTKYDDTLEILRSIRPKYEAHHLVAYTPDALEACVRLSQRYITDRCLPDKAIDVMDEAGSHVHISHLKLPKELVTMEEEMDSIMMEKREAVDKKDYRKATSLRERERVLEEKLSVERNQWYEIQKKNKKEVNADTVAEVVSMITSVPVSRVSESETQRLLNMAEMLKKKLIGQDSAIDAMVRAIHRNRAGLKDPNKPIGTFIFLGPTGVGKTHLAKLLAQYMFDSADNLVRIDMSEYMEKYAVSRLIGAPPGYVGYDEGGQLTERIRRKPYTVVLLDEIEKAHPDIFNLLLQVFDEGRLTDSNGRHVDFRNTILIMTSNIGSRELKEFGGGVGFATVSSNAAHAADTRRRQIIEKALGKMFTPEFLNRVDEQILFNALDKGHIGKIIDIELADLYKRIEQAGFTLEISEKAKDFVAAQGFDPQYGARPLKRAIQRYLEDPLSEAIIRLEMAPGSALHVDLDPEGTNTVVN
ncbi:MAG: ATP-dependent Clp protease ATP-binding subunit, partial [Bacteroidales bacterium]|jgi:ATP-dependent Clp protease ATP-binding subunit ClpC|nr:ATP-dependent Clp protease ATP-binding subunit [Bacteroidales bacterium]MDD3944999.1 ATP-dependent Clp protease ATP-binding subunit [Bacteroidales bacterium]MDD4481565.1 ATP-dependent Clp protease ATP-binding subunit [Bacteroidales bacterium]MDD5714516.1 ATP-dependent Clp protease ATP-binding subunit [Bacteroidales bacterium]NLN36488.1 ATP-dependent Clp protease ATP-binding subunit [Bacteroidales bacterium]